MSIKLFRKSPISYRPRCGAGRIKLMAGGGPVGVGPRQGNDGVLFRARARSAGLVRGARSLARASRALIFEELVLFESLRELCVTT
jgi:hypothetical protein